MHGLENGWNNGWPASECLLNARGQGRSHPIIPDLISESDDSIVEATRQVTARLNDLPHERFHGLDPLRGTGFVTLDLTESIPGFLHQHGGVCLRPLATGTWAFDGDHEVPHYRSIEKTSRQLIERLGWDRLLQLRGFAKATTDYINRCLPIEEQARMAAAQVELRLDLAELRISDGSTANTGHFVHVDWYPREGMVLVIPITGSHTTIYHPLVDLTPVPGRIIGNLLTAYERWTRFHGFDSTNESQSNSRVIVAGDDRVIVPEGIFDYLRSRGEKVPADLRPDFPGVLPTIHRAGTGARTVVVLNFHYARIGSRE
jgi:hypothetical protein